MTLHHICIQTDCYHESLKFLEKYLDLMWLRKPKAFMEDILTHGLSETVS